MRIRRIGGVTPILMDLPLGGVTPEREKGPPLSMGHQPFVEHFMAGLVKAIMCGITQGQGSRLDAAGRSKKITPLIRCLLSMYLST